MNVVFAIGCKHYSDPDVAQLKYADRDAKRFVEAIMSTQDPDNTETYLLHDQHENERFRPTRSNILYFLSQGERRDKSNELDFLFFYFSGHGWSSEDGTDYLLTSDSLVNMPDETAIPVSMLERHLRNWEAKHAVLFIDACRTVMAGGKSVPIQVESRINVDSLCPEGMVTFCSCEPGQTSYEADQISSGVFTEGVCNALGDEGRCSTIEELDEYLNDKVPKISWEYGLPRQRPYSRVEPLAVQNAIIVSQRTLQGWQLQEHGRAAQILPERTALEESLSKYREVAEWAWTSEQLSQRDVQRLSSFADQLNINQSDASAIEREVMGDTKEEILERSKHAAEEEAAKQRYREAVETAWSGEKLSKEEAQGLNVLASQLGLGTDAADIEREVMNATVQAVLQRQIKKEDKHQRYLDELYAEACLGVSNADRIRCLRTLVGHTGDIYGVAFSPDGMLIASASGDKTIRLWKVKSGELLHALEGHELKVNSVAFSPDGALIASGSDDTRLWRAEDGELLHMLEGHGHLQQGMRVVESSISSVVFSPDGTVLAMGSNGTIKGPGWRGSVSEYKTVRLWGVKSRELLRTLEGHIGDYSFDVYSVAFSPDGMLIASGSDDKTVRLWRVKSGELLHTLEGHKLTVTSVAFSPDGALIASGSRDKTIRLWKVKSGEPLHALEGHCRRVNDVAFSPDGALIASASGDKTIRLWKVKSGELLHALEGHELKVNSVAFSPDGTLIASGSDDKTVRLWGLP